jgi:hypothetical protein
MKNISLEPYVMTSSTSNVYPVATTTKVFRPEEFILRRVKEFFLFASSFLSGAFSSYQEAIVDDSSTVKIRQCEEHIVALESLVYEKEITIHDLQRKLDKTTRVCLFVFVDL